MQWLLGEYIEGENKVRGSVPLMDGGGVRDVEPICYLMRGYTRRLMTFRVRERLRRYVAGPTASSENENPGG